MDALWKDVGVIAGTLTSLLVLAGLATRFVLVPYLREHLVKPVQETHHQLTQAHHNQPQETTVLDRLDDLHDAVERLTSSSSAVQSVANAAARSSAQAHRRLDRHENWADTEVSRLWSVVRPSPAQRARDPHREE